MKETFFNLFVIYFTKHAEEKFDILIRHKFKITKEQVIETVNSPDLIDRSRLPLYIAQRTLSKTRVLRVVYKTANNEKLIITFYPGRKTKYEKDKSNR